MSFGVTKQGFKRKDLATIKKEIEDELRSKFGKGTNLLPESVFGQIVGVVAERESAVWEVVEDVYNSYYPGSAEGVALTNVGSITGSTPQGALASTIEGQLLFGTAGTLVQAGRKFSVSGASDKAFETLSDVTLVAGTDEVQKLSFSSDPASGTYKLSFNGQTTSALNWDDDAATVQAALEALSTIGSGHVSVSGQPDQANGFEITFQGDTADGLGKRDVVLMTTSDNSLQDSGSSSVTLTVTEQTKGVPQGEVDMIATETGPLSAPAGSLSVIDTPVSGLEAVVNPEDAELGRDAETDTEFRIRREQELAKAGAATPTAIQADISALDGVTKVIVFSNRNAVEDPDGRPPHSVEVVVEGGDNQEIADELYDTVGDGIGFFGSVSETVTDDDGFPQTVKFSRPTEIDIYIEVDLTTDANVFPDDGVQQVIDAILEYGEALSIGQDVIVFGSDPSVSCSWLSVPGILDYAIRIGKTVSPSADDNIDIQRSEIAKFDSSRTTVSVL